MLKFKNILKFYLCKYFPCMYVRKYVWNNLGCITTSVPGTCGGQKRVLDSMFGAIDSCETVWS